MIKIGLLSDTHGYVDERLFSFFEPCTQLWHAGDMGNLETAAKLDSFRPLIAVHGNIDGYEIRQQYKPIQNFVCEKTSVLLTHIGGYPGHYDTRMNGILFTIRPRLFICGHSHILKVMKDPKLNLLHINPGAAGNSGFHKVKTAIRFDIDGEQVTNLEIWEAAR